MPVLLAVAVLLFQAANVRAVTYLDPVEGKKEAQELVGKLLALQPMENATNYGVLKIMPKDKTKRVEIPVKFGVAVTPSNWQMTYQTDISSTNGDFTFARSHFASATIIRSPGQPDVYQVPNINRPPQDTNEVHTLTGDQRMTAFAGSDFWVGDLGLDFLRWPVQRVVKKEFTHECGCSVLESLNPNPNSQGYSKVLTWFDNDSLGVVQAQAYDAKGVLLKEFHPKSITKVNGQWQVDEIEMDNVQTGSRTLITFNLDK